MKILLADDEKEMTNALSAIFRFNGYDVDCVYDGQAAFDAAFNNDYDALVFDVMMPKMSGMDAVAALREKNVSTPAILLTAKSEYSDRIAGLDSGADDYLTKPFNTGELLARLRALIRRGNDSKNDALVCGNVTMSRENLEIKTTAASFRLAGKEFKLLELLVSRVGTPVSEQQFIDRIFDDEEDEKKDGVVFLYISYLRTKLNAIGANFKINTTADNRYVLVMD